MIRIKQTIELEDAEAFGWFEQLLKIDTTNAHGNERAAANYLQEILKKEGICSEVFENEPGRANLVSKLNGGDESPLLLISHLDVVEADESKWKYPPFSANLADNEIWARGTLDTKHLTIMQLAAFITLKRQGIPLNRDVYFIATADEENGSDQGMAFMTSQHGDYFPNGTVINEGGGFYITYRGKEYLLLSVGEKGSCTLKINTTGQSGHASCPPENQAVKKMAAAIMQLLDTPLPEPQTDVAEVFLDVLGIDENATEAIDLQLNSSNDDENLLKMLYHYMLSNDIRVNRIDVGEQINAIPYKANAEVEFKLLPDTTKEEIIAFIQYALKDVDAQWEIENLQEGFINDSDTLIVSLFRKAIRKFGFEGDLLPFLALGRTDGRFLKNANVFGFSPVCADTPFATVLKKVHQPDESISVRSFVFGTQVIRETVLNYCQNK